MEKPLRVIGVNDKFTRRRDIQPSDTTDRVDGLPRFVSNAGSDHAGTCSWMRQEEVRRVHVASPRSVARLEPDLL